MEGGECAQLSEYWVAGSPEETHSEITSTIVTAGLVIA